MKYELKIEFKHNQELETVIQKSYFEDGTLGKLVGKKGFVTIKSEDPMFIIFKGLNNMTVKLINEEMIDGSMRCVVDELNDIINLYPINNYCIVEDKKYSFY
jgi:hypothetical protein